MLPVKWNLKFCIIFIMNEPLGFENLIVWKQQVVIVTFTGAFL